MRKINAKWAARVLRSTNFMVITDNDAALWLDIRNPRKLTSVVALQSQRAVLRMFETRLQSLMRDHDKALEKARKRGKVIQGRSKANTATRKGA